MASESTADELHLAPKAAYAQTLLGQFDAKLLASPRAGTILVAILGAILTIPAIQASVQIRKVDSSAFRASGERHRTALGRWLPDAMALSAGEDPYGPGHWFPTSPLVLMTLVPLSKMPYAAAGFIWAITKVAGVLMSSCCCIGPLQRRMIVRSAFG
jgi:hypothetical protein